MKEPNPNHSADEQKAASQAGIRRVARNTIVLILLSFFAFLVLFHIDSSGMTGLLHGYIFFAFLFAFIAVGINSVKTIVRDGLRLSTIWIPIFYIFITIFLFFAFLAMFFG